MTKTAGSGPAEKRPSAPPEKADDLQIEARTRWGRTKAYRQSRERTAKFSKEDRQRISAEADANMEALAALLAFGKTPDDPEVQVEIARHHADIERFYDCPMKMYRGLAEMYLADRRFADHYRRYHPELPEFLAAAMNVFCDREERRTR